jgi:hypothetical protein
MVYSSGFPPPSLFHNPRSSRRRRVAAALWLQPGATRSLLRIGLRSALPAAAHSVRQSRPDLLQLGPPLSARRRRSCRRLTPSNPAAGPSAARPVRLSRTGLPRRSGRPRAARRAVRRAARPWPRFRLAPSIRPFASASIWVLGDSSHPSPPGSAL